MRKEKRLSLSLDRRELDAIREIGTIGAGHAATALSRLTGARVGMKVPSLALQPLAGMPPIFHSFEEPAVGVLLPYQGDLEGNMLFLFAEEGLHRLESYLFRKRKAPDNRLWDSAISETGSILGGAFLTILSGLTGRLLIPQPPVLIRDMAGAILDPILAEIGCRYDCVLVMTSSLTDQEGNLLAQTILVPDPAGIRLLLEAAERFRSAR